MQISVLLLLFTVALAPTACAVIYLCKKNRALSTIIGLGAFSWLVALIRSAILKPIYLLIGSLQPPPIWFIGLSATLAGVFEEGFRYKFLKSFVEERTWFNGIAFGLGAALLEILLIYCIPIIKMAIVGSGSQNFSEMLAGAVERNLVVCIHVGSALLVMHSLRNRWILGIAVSFHSIVDFIAPTLGYYSSLTIWQVESIVAIFAVVALVITCIERVFLSKPTESVT